MIAENMFSDYIGNVFWLSVWHESL